MSQSIRNLVETESEEIPHENDGFNVDKNSNEKSSYKSDSIESGFIEDGSFTHSNGDKPRERY